MGKEWCGERSRISPWLEQQFDHAAERALRSI
jgi:hypothetical protein